MHCIPTSLTWMLGVTATDENLDGDGSATAFKCSNPGAKMWLEETTADASGGVTENFAIEVTGSAQIFKRDHTNVAGTEEAVGGTV